MTDFYSAHNKLPGKKQKCLIHLMREMHRLFMKDQSSEFLKYHKKLKRIITDVLRLNESRAHLDAPVLKRRIKRLKERLFLWSCREYRNKNLLRLAKRFLKHWLYLLTFLEHPEVSFNNNLAERMIRHHVILRNRSFQNRSQEGAYAHENLTSLLHTLKLQGEDVVPFLKKAYLRHSPVPLLAI